MVNHLFHLCGEPISVEARWNGLSHYTAFLDENGETIDCCPQCRETLLPRDVGASILPGEEVAAAMDEESKTPETYAGHRLAAMHLRKIFGAAEARVDEYETITGDANTAAGLRAYLGQAIERLDAEWGRQKVEKGSDA